VRASGRIVGKSPRKHLRHSFECRTVFQEEEEKEEKLKAFAVGVTCFGVLKVRSLQFLVSLYSVKLTF
jgi:hypothetical protein